MRDLLIEREGSGAPRIEVDNIVEGILIYLCILISLKGAEQCQDIRTLLILIDRLETIVRMRFRGKTLHACQNLFWRVGMVKRDQRIVILPDLFRVNYRVILLDVVGV